MANLRATCHNSGQLQQHIEVRGVGDDQLMQKKDVIEDIVILHQNINVHQNYI